MTDVASKSAHDRRQRRLLVGIALMFFAPLGLAFYLYYGHWHPGGRVNAGELVDPARPLPAIALPLLAGGHTEPSLFKGKWTLLYVEQGGCDAACLKRLYDTRQVRIALDRDMGRVQRVLIADPDCCDLKALARDHPDLIAVSLSPEVAPLLIILPSAVVAKATSVYLVDPLGNLMMAYPADTPSKGMLEDLKRLLRLSSIG